MDTRESGPAIAATSPPALPQAEPPSRAPASSPPPPSPTSPTPTASAAGIVISASHNPWEDNGIKVFGPDGYKLPDATEIAIEDEIFRPPEQENAVISTEAQRSGETRFSATDATPPPSTKPTAPTTSASSSPPSPASPSTTAASSSTAPTEPPPPSLQSSSLSSAATMSSSPTPRPDGRNINEHCGALHPEIVAAAVRHHKASLGITFDGDADRALFADEHGNVVNGDAVLLLAARDLQARGLLTNSTVVATTMSNMGLEAALKRSGIQMLRAAVGDKYVLEQMLATKAALGGEQSGHIIFSGRSTTGDGLLTALLLLDIVHRTGKSLAELIADLKVFPQVIVNVKVREKKPLDGIPTVAAAIAAAEKELADSGRVVIRYSGTEALARVMIEAESEPLMRHHADTIANAIRTELGV